MFLSVHSALSLSVPTLDILFVCSPSSNLAFPMTRGGLNQINRDQSQPEEVNPVKACVLRTQESEPVETNFRKAPDLQKDDLAQRRIQGRHTPHREAPRFIKLASITEADLETWERLKVSEKTRCVMVLPLIMVGIPFRELSNYPGFIFYFDGCQECLSQHRTSGSGHVLRERKHY